MTFLSLRLTEPSYQNSALQMHFKLFSSVSFVVAVVTTVTQAAETKWYTERSCKGGAALDYKNLGCNICVDPSLGMFSIFIFCVLDVN
jgi:hypothetical protein